MKLAIAPWAAAMSAISVRSSVKRSAVVTAGAKPKLISYWPLASSWSSALTPQPELLHRADDLLEHRRRAQQRLQVVAGLVEHVEAVVGLQPALGLGLAQQEELRLHPDERHHASLRGRACTRARIARASQVGDLVAVHDGREGDRGVGLMGQHVDAGRIGHGQELGMLGAAREAVVGERGEAGARAGRAGRLPRAAGHELGLGGAVDVDPLDGDEGDAVGQRRASASTAGMDAFFAH